MTDATSRKPYDFQWGDRIDHPNYGMGTVIGEPIAVAGAEPSPRFGSDDRGWRVPVEWDDPGRTAGSVSSDSIKMVERPDAKGGAFWNHEFQRLLSQAISARSVTDISLRAAFRHRQGSQVGDIKALIEAEQQILNKVLQFLNVDETGNHA
jgi:hypothetical protein